MERFKLNPDIFNDRLVFVSNNDVWEVSIEGGKAQRITSGIGVINNVRYSPDGKRLVFRVMRGYDASYADIYGYDFKSGKLSRLTYLSGKSTSRRMYTDMAGWDEMGNPVISTDVLSPFTAQTFHWFDPDLYPGYVYLLFSKLKIIFTRLPDFRQEK